MLTGGLSRASIVSTAALMRIAKLQKLQELHGYNGALPKSFLTL
jgi:hypothetical protein